MITLTISFDPKTGKLDVRGPLGDRILCLGLMEAAKDQILSYVPPDPKLVSIANGAVAKVMQAMGPKG